MILLYAIGVIFFIFLEGFFSGAETAFISSNIFRLKGLKHKGHPLASYVLEILDKPSKLLSCTLIGTNLSVICSSALFTYILIMKGVKNPSFFATIILTPLVLIFGEVIPKRIARIKTDKFSLRAVKFLRLFSRILFPLVFIAETLSDFVAKRLIKKREHSHALNKEDLLLLLREVEKEGVLDEDEVDAIEDVFDFGLLKSKDIMIPIKKAVFIDWNNSEDQILQKARQHKFTRYPVVENNNIIGVLNIFDFFYEDKNWHDCIRPIMKVGRSERLDDIFSKMQQAKENIVCVVKGNKIIGILTIDDLMKEIVSNFI